MPVSFKRKGIVFVLSAPSGTGKSTLIDGLRAVQPEILLSVSCTTRRQRPGEKRGRHYHFVTRRQFLQMKKKGEFAEWAKVHNFLYGTPRKLLESCINNGRDILLDIDVQGARKIKRVYPQAVSIFVLPPSMRELRRRLSRRGTDDRETIRRRLANAEGEIRRIFEYDYFIINRKVIESVRLLRVIIKAESARTLRVKGWSFSGPSTGSTRRNDEQGIKNRRVG